MASLGQLLENRVQIQIAETNLETGSIWLHTGSPMNDDTHFFCWESPGNGTAVIEVWGAGGSGAVSCCCGTSIPGNPGAYSKLTVPVSSSSFVCGCTGCSQRSTDSTSPGRGGHSAIIVCSETGCNCLCVQAGESGKFICMTGNQQRCCWSANGYPTNNYGTGCGTVCNLCNNCADCVACAYGGDINVKGGISCASFWACNPCCYCKKWHHMQTPPYISTATGAQVSFLTAEDRHYAPTNGSPIANYQHAMGTLSRNPVRGIQQEFCWTSGRHCNCYPWNSCRTQLSAGFPGVSGTSCDGHRDYGQRGGMGAIRITFISG